MFCSKALRAFRAGDIQVLVSSDAMTRGMDVEGVTNVINYDIPAYVKTYIHRAGRTARAGQAGRCFTLLRKDEVCVIVEVLFILDYFDAYDPDYAGQSRIIFLLRVWRNVFPCFFVQLMTACCHFSDERI